MDRRTQKIMEHLTGPTGSVILHGILVFLLGKYLVFNVLMPSHEVEAKIMEVEEVDLEEFDRNLEKLPDLPKIEEAVPEVTEKPPEVENVTPDQEDLSTLDVLNSQSPLVMKGLYSGRLSAASRKSMLDKYAGTIGELTEKAVIKALRWLKEHQQGNGSWQPKGESKYTPGITGLGLLTFLAHGETTASEEFGSTVEKAIKYLISAQHESGAFFDPNAKDAADPKKKPSQYGPNMYASYWHAMATYAVSEAYGLMRIPELKPVMQKAVRVIIDGQQPAGGWNYAYTKTSRRDTSIAGWQVQALKAASIAGAEIEGIDQAIVRGIENLKLNCNPNGGLFWYESEEKDTGRGLSNQRLRNNTGIGVLSLQLLGQGMSKEAKKGLSALKVADCKWNNPSDVSWPLYGWYYITQAKFHNGGADWTSWNNKFARVLVDNQNQDGHWDAPLTDGKPGGEDRQGPVYCTTLAALTLQVYYRFLPTYQAKAVEVQEISAETAKDDVVIDF
ncbi:MAG: terpene cyclase/mutase family protein [Kiritimatiellae bacterium]|nr:terpene cyclase/mutase family protein [Kiritimatiellia bacterium]